MPPRLVAALWRSKAIVLNHRTLVPLMLPTNLNMAMKAWTDISANPNDARVLAARASNLANARRSRLIDSRQQYLCDLARGKRVLDIGVVEHVREASSQDGWLHKHISQSAKSCLGI